MNDKHTEAVTEAEARRRVKKHMAALRKKHPVLPVNEDEPLGLLAGDPDNIDKYDELDEYEDLTPKELRDKFTVYKTKGSFDKSDSDK